MLLGGAASGLRGHLAANGVDLREPLKPAPPEVARKRVARRSVIVMIVLLKEAWTWAMPSDTTFFAFLRARGWLARPWFCVPPDPVRRRPT
jgi:hypothetical protein